MSSKLLSIFLLSILVSCSGGMSERPERQEVTDFTQAPQSAAYMLPDLPNWASTSATGRCFKASNPKYVDLTKIRQSFGFSYEQGIQFQLLFNELIQQKSKETRTNFLLAKDEEVLFFQTKQKIEGNLRSFKIRPFSPIHVIWMDWALNSPAHRKDLHRLLHSPEVNKGLPIFASFCTSFQNEEEMQKTLGLTSFGLSTLPLELYNPYNSAGNLTTQVGIDLGQLFLDKEVVLYVPKGAGVPPEFFGKFKVREY